ncbi:MAG: hypothetical protein K1060chlam5_00101 [Candidatus Anoxychlamydiales bacterium]|nr:hypothetical protein [Candidatus Anoxychlamydiales bacterium]
MAVEINLKRTQLLNEAREFNVGQKSLRDITAEKINDMDKTCFLGFLGRAKKVGYSVMYATVNFSCSKGLARKIKNARKASILYSVVCNYASNSALERPAAVAQALGKEAEAEKAKRAGELFETTQTAGAADANPDTTATEKKVQ